jgi:hypothetical protein
MRFKLAILLGFIAVTGLLGPVFAATRSVMCEEYYWSG